MRYNPPRWVSQVMLYKRQSTQDLRVLQPERIPIRFGHLKIPLHCYVGFCTRQVHIRVLSKTSGGRVETELFV